MPGPEVKININYEKPKGKLGSQSVAEQGLPERGLVMGITMPPQREKVSISACYFLKVRI